MYALVESEVSLLVRIRFTRCETIALRKWSRKEGKKEKEEYAEDRITWKRGWVLRGRGGGVLVVLTEVNSFLTDMFA